MKPYVRAQYDLAAIGACNLDIFFADVRTAHYGTASGQECVLDQDIDVFLTHLSRLGYEPAYTSGGGQAANAAVAACRCGVSTALISSVGADRWATVAVGDMDCVDVSHVRRSGKTARAIILLGRSGERTIFLDRMVDSVLPFDLPDVDARHFHFTSTVSSADVSKSIDWISRLRQSATTSVDGGALYAAKEGLEQMYANANIVFVTEEELSMISGRSPIEGAQWMNALGTDMVCIKKGSRGASLVIRGGRTFHSSAIAVQAIDTTGAGDAFAGAFLAAYLRGSSAPDSLTYATRYASLSVRGFGRSAFARQDLTHTSAEVS